MQIRAKGFPTAAPFGTRSALHESCSTLKSHIFNSVNVATSRMSSDVHEPEARIPDCPCPASINKASPMTKKDKMGTDLQLSEMVSNKYPHRKETCSLNLSLSSE